MEEENDLMIDQYENLDPHLDCFDLPESVLWIKKVDKKQADKAAHTNKLAAEYLTG